MRSFFTLLLCCLLSQNAISQELLASVSVSTPRIQGTNRTIYTAMQKSIYDLLTTTSWTNRVYAPEERIECSFLFNITEEVNAGEFKATLQVQAKRPVYGSSYTTVLLNYMDNDIQFRYNEFDKLEYNPHQRVSNLVSILSYYAFLIIGLDDDSFSLRGGTQWFKNAEKIVIDSQTEPTPGWKPYEGGSHKNRYWIVENMLNSKYGNMRSALYKYNRLGLDKMSERINEGRDQVYEALLDVQRVFRNKPDPYLLGIRMFFDTKADEIVNIFLMSPAMERVKMYQLLTEIDMPNEAKYKKLKEERSEF